MHTVSIIIDGKDSRKGQQHYEFQPYSLKPRKVKDGGSHWSIRVNFDFLS